MIWSISSFKEFQSCERKWFLNSKLGSRSKKDSSRQKVYFLSELESIESWRGKIVDYTISEYVIPLLNKKRTAPLRNVIEYAKKLFDARYAFAKSMGYKTQGLKKTEHYFEYSALYDLEFNKVDIDQVLAKAWIEIELSLTNFITSKLFTYLKEANYLVTQRTLIYEAHDVTVKGVPDLIAFFPEKPPHIFDWKVHYSDVKTYTEQLLIYAKVLTSCDPHRDFKEYLEGYSVFDIRLSEYQLLSNRVRHYSIDEDYVERINDYVAGSIEKMLLKKCHLKFEELDIEDFEKTHQVDKCSNCVFIELCK